MRRVAEQEALAEAISPDADLWLHTVSVSAPHCTARCLEAGQARLGRPRGTELHTLIATAQAEANFGWRSPAFEVRPERNSRCTGALVTRVQIMPVHACPKVTNDHQDNTAPPVPPSGSVYDLSSSPSSLKSHTELIAPLSGKKTRPYRDRLHEEPAMVQAPFLNRRACMPCTYGYGLLSSAIMRLSWVAGWPAKPMRKSTVYCESASQLRTPQPPHTVTTAPHCHCKARLRQPDV